MSGISFQKPGQCVIVAFLSLVLVDGCMTVPMSCPLPRQASTNLPTQGISAHQGGKLGCPVNTIGAFQRAISLGVHQIEFDVRASADHVIVVAHDDVILESNPPLYISETSYDEIKKVALPSCQSSDEAQYIPTLRQALSIMPDNIWLNVDIKENDLQTGKLVAATVAEAGRLDQVIFAARNRAIPGIRQMAVQAGGSSWIANMNRQMFRSQYVEATIHSCAEFIQLVDLPAIPFLRGKPSQDTLSRLNQAGIRVNYSWLEEADPCLLQHEIHDLFTRGVDFILVDHIAPAMQAAETFHIPPLVTQGKKERIPSDQLPLGCSE